VRFKAKFCKNLKEDLLGGIWTALRTVRTCFLSWKIDFLLQKYSNHWTRSHTCHEYIFYDHKRKADGKWYV